MIAPRKLCAAIATVAVVFLVGLAPVSADVQQSIEPRVDEGLSVELNEGRLVRLDQPVNSVFIANADIADVRVKSPRLVYLYGKRAGETTLYAVDENERVIANYRIRVSHNLSGLNQALDRLFPDGGVTATSIDNGLLLTGQVADSSDAENAQRLAQRFISKGEALINRLQVMAPNQVNLRVRVAEVTRSVVRQFGFNWDAIYEGSSFTLGLATGNPVLLGGQGISPPIIDERFFLTRNLGTNSIFGGGSAGDFDINGLIDLLQQDGLVTVLAEPNLTALSGETASFLAGGEFPIPVGVGDDQIAIQFKEFGVSLSFTPTLLNGNRISMRVRPEVSQLTNAGAIILQNISVPGLTTRRAETTVELASGQSFAIAGLFLDNTLHNVNSVPGLADLPILGNLFRSDRFERNETELMIIVTPYVVTPVNTRIPVPTDAYVAGAGTQSGSTGTVAQAPNATQATTLNTGSRNAQSARGRSGFIVE